MDMTDSGSKSSPGEKVREKTTSPNLESYGNGETRQASNRSSMEKSNPSKLLLAHSRSGSYGSCASPVRDMSACSSRSLRKRYGRELLSSIILAIYGASGGCIMGFSSPTTPILKASGVLEDDQIGWYQAVPALGSLTGTLIVSFVMQLTSRKTTIYISTLPFTAGWLCMVVAPDSFVILCIGRFITGVGGGLLLIVALVYIAETASKEIRGALIMVMQVGATLGILLTYTAGMFLDVQWLAVIALLPVAIIVIPLYYLPESPRWLVMKGHNEEAIHALMWFRNDTEANIKDELEEIEQNIHTTRHTMATGGSIKQNLPKLWRPLVIGTVLSVFTQLTGFAVILNNVQAIFNMAGWTGSNGSVPAIIIAAIKVVCVFMIASLIDRLGRRILIIAGGIIMGLSAAVMGFYFHYQNDIPASYKWISLLALILYESTFAVSWGTIPWMFITESLPLQFRGFGLSILSTVSLLSSFIILSQFTAVVQVIAWSGLFWIFSGMSLLAALFAVVFVPETTGMSLERIEHELSISISA